MGTSQSSPGPGGDSPLVPPWAEDPSDQPGLPPLPPPEPTRFKGFRQSLGKFIATGERNNLESALGHYARKGTGGAGGASRRMGAITKAGGSLYGALSSGGTFGAPGNESISLNDLAGLPCDAAVAAISQALTPNGGDADKIRVAMNHALVEALDGVDVFDPEMITDDVIVGTMICYLAESIFLQIVMDSNKAWNKAASAAHAVAAENDLQELIKVVVDQYMAPRLVGQVESLSSSDFVQIEKQVITEVWTEWEGYQ